MISSLGGIGVIIRYDNQNITTLSRSPIFDKKAGYPSISPRMKRESNSALYGAEQVFPESQRVQAKETVPDFFLLASPDTQQATLAVSTSITTPPASVSSKSGAARTRVGD